MKKNKLEKGDKDEGEYMSSLHILGCTPGSEWNFTEVTGIPGLRISHQSMEPSS